MVTLRHGQLVIKRDVVTDEFLVWIILKDNDTEEYRSYCLVGYGKDGFGPLHAARGVPIEDPSKHRGEDLAYLPDILMNISS